MAAGSPSQDLIDLGLSLVEASGAVLRRHFRAGRLRRGARSLPAHLGVVVRALPGARLVPRREIRHLGPLGSAMPAGDGRLVRPAHVPAREPDLPVSQRALRAPVAVRLQGRDQHLEGGALGAGEAPRPLQARRREVFRRHGQPPRQPRPLRFEIPAVEFRRSRAEEGFDRRLGGGGPQAGTALRRQCSRAYFGFGTRRSRR